MLLKASSCESVIYEPHPAEMNEHKTKQFSMAKWAAVVRRYVLNKRDLRTYN